MKVPHADLREIVKWRRSIRLLGEKFTDPNAAVSPSPDVLSLSKLHAVRLV